MVAVSVSVVVAIIWGIHFPFPLFIPIVSLLFTSQMTNTGDGDPKTPPANTLIHTPAGVRIITFSQDIQPHIQQLGLVPRPCKGKTYCKGRRGESFQHLSNALEFLHTLKKNKSKLVTISSLILSKCPAIGIVICSFLLQEVPRKASGPLLIRTSTKCL